MTLLDSTPRPATALERTLASLDWRMDAARRVALPAGDVSMPIHATSGFLYVSSGTGTVLSIGEQPIAVEAGDLVFFTRSGEHRIRADAELIATDVAFEPRMPGAGGLDVLPAMLTVRGFASREPAMVALIGTMGCSGATRLGDAVVCDRIATTIATVALRLWAELGCAPTAWLSRVDDPHIARVLDVIHADLDRAWTVEELARVAMMSRSSFAVRFRETVGHSPANYVAAARVDSGMELLRTGELTVSQVAMRLGYESEDGFSRAFRRHTGATPSLWRAAQLGATVAAVAV